jgi:flagellar hook-associated protein 1 FlgK
LGTFWDEADMTGLTNLVQIGLSGLTAASEAIETVSNNTANVNTPGYDAQSVKQTERLGTDGVGSGTDVSSIQRAFDQFVDREVVQANSANQAAQVVQTNSQAIAALFPVASGGAGGLGASLDSFFSAANGLTQDPTSAANCEVFLSDAQSLASTFHSVGGGVATKLTTVNGQISDAVQQVNGLAQQIANLNQAIARQRAGPWSAPSNSLLDQRDELVQQLGQQLGVTTVQGANGALDVYTSSGAVLVDGASSYQLAVASGNYGDGGVAITYAPTKQDLTNSLSGGQLGGLLTSRAQLVSTQDTVGALATGFTSAVNKQQTLGLDLNGNLGQPFLSLTGPTVYPAQSNTGSGTLSAAITDPTALLQVISF